MEITTLKNGLKVATVKNPASELVTIQLWIKSGSVYESKTERGLSHFIEHLLFKGTRNHAVGELARSVESLGGDLNAFTSMEQTCYHVSLPSLYLEQALSSICDLVFYPLFEQTEIDNEREVILEEIKRSKDLPDRVMMTNFFNIHFKGHPYAEPVLGSDEVIKNISRDAIIDYYKRFYNPANALLVICGNVDKNILENTLSNLYEKITCNDAADNKNEKIIIPQMGLEKDFSIKIKQMDLIEANFVIGFPIPGLVHKDVPALDILALILGQGESSRLVKNLRLEKGIVTSVYTSSYTPKHGGSFFIGFSIDSTDAFLNSKLDSIFDAIAEEINFLRTGDFCQKEIDKAKTILLSDRIYERETVEGFAKKIGSLISITGNMDFEEQYFSWLKNVSKQDIIDVIQKYFITSKASVSAVVSKEMNIENSEIKKRIEKLNIANSTLKKEKQDTEYNNYISLMNNMMNDLSDNFDKDFLIDEPKIIKDKSGAKIVLRKISSTPLVSIRILFPGGTRFENEATQGIFNLLSRTWLYGAGSYSSSQIAEIIDGTASSIEAFSGRNSLGLSFDVLKAFVPNILDIGTQLLIDPKFDLEYLNTEKMVIKDEIKSLQDNLVYYSGLLLLKTIYKNHPYRYEVQGTLETVETFTQKDLLSLFKQYIVANRMVISVTGDFDEKIILDWVNNLIQKMQINQASYSLMNIEPEQTEPRITSFKKESNQAHIALAYITCDICSDDRFVLRLISALLSGQSGRLFLNLRDKKSLAYTVTPVMMFGPDPGYFGIYIACDPEKTDTSISEIRREIAVLKNEAVPEIDLLRAKNFILGRHVLSMQRFGEQSITMGFDELYGLGYKAMLEFSDKILKITEQDIMRVANKYFHEKRENIVIVSKK